MFGEIFKRIFLECWCRHEWVDIGNGELTYDEKVLAQCAVCFKTKSFQPHMARDFITYDEWIEKRNAEM